MRILTVRQPWAWAIIHGGKDVENRVRNIAGDYRGPVAIHAGVASFEKENAASRAHAAAHGGETDTVLHYGGIIGVVDLVDVHKCYEACTAWSEPGAFHLVLKAPRVLADPIPYRGALGLRRLEEDVSARIEAQIGGVQ